MAEECILAIDQGTTGTTVLLVGKQGQILKRAYREIQQFYPKPGWVEHDPDNIWDSVVSCIEECLSNQWSIQAIGITNQRETTVLWDAITSKPLHPAIVWQCARSADICQSLSPHEKQIKDLTGLPISPYFSGSKITWLKNHLGGLPKNTLFGTIDSWLVWKLSSGKVHATDPTNASRTLLYDIHQKSWSKELLDIFQVDATILPEVRPSMSDFGSIESIPALKGVPILGLAGDQQAALFGQMGFYPGALKNTYGTGAFMMLNTGNEAIPSQNGLLTTLAISDQGEACYALEGSVFICGAAIQWLRDGLNLIDTASESESLCLSIPNNEGVYFVPAFSGLGAPYWNPDVRGLISGLTRGSTKAHIVRAAVESMAYQSLDILNIMEKESEQKVQVLAVDGGATQNSFLMQFQADIAQKEIYRPQNIETTSMGAAYLAGLKHGFWKDTKHLQKLIPEPTIFKPQTSEIEYQSYLKGWKSAIEKTLA